MGYRWNPPASGPEQLAVSETSESRNVVSYLDLLIDVSNGELVHSIFEKTDTFDFHIVNFPDLKRKFTQKTCWSQM